MLSMKQISTQGMSLKTKKDTLYDKRINKYRRYNICKYKTHLIREIQNT